METQRVTRGPALHHVSAVSASLLPSALGGAAVAGRLWDCRLPSAPEGGDLPHRGEAGGQDALSCPSWWGSSGRCPGPAGREAGVRPRAVGLAVGLQSQGWRSESRADAGGVRLRRRGSGLGWGHQRVGVAGVSSPLPRPQAGQEVLVWELHQSGEGRADLCRHQGQAPELHQGRHRPRLPVGEPRPAWDGDPGLRDRPCPRRPWPEDQAFGTGPNGGWAGLGPWVQ